jgi:hypothetical protein
VKNKLKDKDFTRERNHSNTITSNLTLKHPLTRMASLLSRQEESKAEEEPTEEMVVAAKEATEVAKEVAT